MTDARKPPSRPPPRALVPAEPQGAFARARAYVTHRVDPLTSLFLVVPLFLIYHLGVLLQMDSGAQGCRWAGNGVDFITSTLLNATHGSRTVYALIALGTAAALVVAVLWARRRSRLHPRLFLPVLGESALWASLVGPIVIAVLPRVTLGAPGQSSFLGDVVASCGAGLHEELIFRAGIFAGSAWLLKKTGVKSWIAVGTAAVGSALLFSAVHHVGSLGEPFTLTAFVFRFVAGLVFTTIYQARGFAIAAWTHALYDVWVFGGQRFGH